MNWIWLSLVELVVVAELVVVVSRVGAQSACQPNPLAEADYPQVYLPNPMGESNLTVIVNQYKQLAEVLNGSSDACLNRQVLRLMELVLFPPCDNSSASATMVQPCREDCLEAKSNCSSQLSSLPVQMSGLLQCGAYPSKSADGLAGVCFGDGRFIRTTVCPLMDCRQACSNGFQVDENDCRTCRCIECNVTANCFVDPCSVASCPSAPDAVCTADYCGGCFARFFKRGRLIRRCPELTTAATTVAMSTAAKCPPFHCSMNCPYGFKLDENDCLLCQCEDPCKSAGDCENKGQCVDGRCVCGDGFEGAFCESHVSRAPESCVPLSDHFPECPADKLGYTETLNSSSTAGDELRRAMNSSGLRHEHCPSFLPFACYSLAPACPAVSGNGGVLACREYCQQVVKACARFVGILSGLYPDLKAHFVCDKYPSALNTRGDWETCWNGSAIVRRVNSLPQQFADDTCSSQGALRAPSNNYYICSTNDTGATSAATLPATIGPFSVEPVGQCPSSSQCQLFGQHVALKLLSYTNRSLDSLGVCCGLACPCQNGGSCVADSPARMARTCLCPPGHFGRLCEQNQDLPLLSCDLPKSYGSCSNTTTMVYFDSRAGRCEPFTYSGCGGNKNRFATIADCEAECSPSCEQSSDCRNGGTCVRAMASPPAARSTENRCVCASGFYGSRCIGRRGTGSPGSKASDCELKVEYGNCTDFSQQQSAYYFDQTSKTCRPFTYSGCNGNANRFDSELTCRETCLTKSSSPSPPTAPRDRCSAPLDFGNNCSATMQMSLPGARLLYAYNTTSRQCQPIRYLGCGGNDNKFASLSACNAICSASYRCPTGGVSLKLGLTSMTCSTNASTSQLKERGTCPDRFYCHRLVDDPHEAICCPMEMDPARLELKPGACPAPSSPSNLLHPSAAPNCSHTCDSDSACPTSLNSAACQRTICLPTNSSTLSMCQLERIRALDKATSFCKYPNCSGQPDNSYYAALQCDFCRNSPSCSCHEKNGAIIPGTTRRYINGLPNCDRAPCDRSCREFAKSCANGMAFFSPSGSCGQCVCVSVTKPPVTRPPTGRPNNGSSKFMRCREDASCLPVMTGLLVTLCDQLTANSSSKEPFICVPYNSAEHHKGGRCCQKISETTAGVPTRCHQPMAIGRCKMHKPRYFFNLHSGACELFIYGGCGGNDNRFESLESCEKTCPTLVKPNKTGSCPAPSATPSPSRSCAHNCNDDDDCAKSEKCCWNGCASRCIASERDDKGLRGCALRRDQILLINFVNGATFALPQCDGGPTKTEWAEKQCDPLLNVCWCVKPETGHLVTGTMSQGPKFLSCDRYTPTTQPGSSFALCAGTSTTPVRCRLSDCYRNQCIVKNLLTSQPATAAKQSTVCFSDGCSPAENGTCRTYLNGPGGGHQLDETCRRSSVQPLSGGATCQQYLAGLYDWADRLSVSMAFRDVLLLNSDPSEMVANFAAKLNLTSLMTSTAMKPNKPGRCPIPSTRCSQVTHRCRDDSSCPPKQKCCMVGCEMNCTTPLSDIPSTSGSRLLLGLTDIRSTMLCNSDGHFRHKQQVSPTTAYCVDAVSGWLIAGSLVLNDASAIQLDCAVNGSFQLPVGARAFSCPNGGQPRLCYGACEAAFSEAASRCGRPDDLVLKALCAVDVCSPDCRAELINRETGGSLDNCKTPSVKEICGQPVDSGTCSNRMVRWYYDSASDSCKSFEYGGCGGNNNRFASLALCQKSCQRRLCDTSKVSICSDVCERPLPSKSLPTCSESVCVADLCSCTARYFLPNLGVELNCSADLGPCFRAYEKGRLGLVNSTTVHPAVYLPQCLADGTFRPVQCLTSTKHLSTAEVLDPSSAFRVGTSIHPNSDCWCVDPSGQKTAGSPPCPATTALGFNMTIRVAADFTEVDASDGDDSRFAATVLAELRKQLNVYKSQLQRLTLASGSIIIRVDVVDVANLQRFADFQPKVLRFIDNVEKKKAFFHWNGRQLAVTDADAQVFYVSSSSLPPGWTPKPLSISQEGTSSTNTTIALVLGILLPLIAFVLLVVAAVFYLRKRRADKASAMAYHSDETSGGYVNQVYEQTGGKPVTSSNGSSNEFGMKTTTRDDGVYVTLRENDYVHLDDSPYIQHGASSAGAPSSGPAVFVSQP